MPREVQVERMRKRGYVTPMEAAEIAGVALGSIYYWLNCKHVHGKRVGSARYVKLDSLQHHLGM